MWQKEGTLDLELEVSLRERESRERRHESREKENNGRGKRGDECAFQGLILPVATLRFLRLW